MHAAFRSILLTKARSPVCLALPARLASSGHSSGQRPSFQFLPPLSSDDTQATHPVTESISGNNNGASLLADLRNRYSNSSVLIRPETHLVEALTAAAHCQLNPTEAANLQKFFTQEATRWNFGLGQHNTWLIRALHHLSAAAAAAAAAAEPSSPSQLFLSLAQYALDTEPMNRSPTTLLAVANASSAANCSAVTHRALSKLLDCGASTDQLAAMSAVVCRLLAKHPDRQLYQRWRQFAVNSQADSAAVSSSKPAPIRAAGTPSLLLRNPALIGRFGTDKELLELYASAEAVWDAGSVSGLHRQPAPVLTADFLEALSASGRLKSLQDVRRRILLPMRQRRGLPIDAGAVPRLLELLNHFQPAGGTWTARTVSLADIPVALKPASSLADHRVRSCPVCGGQLQHESYRAEPTQSVVDRLLAAVSNVLEPANDSYQRVRPDVLASYKRWLADCRAANGPFDLVIDGSNLVLHRGGAFNKSKRSVTIKMSIQHISASVDWLLKQQQQQQAKRLHIGILYKVCWTRETQLFAFQAALSQLRQQHPGIEAITMLKVNSSDDLLALHAALSSGPGCYMLSKDYFRDHSSLLGAGTAGNLHRQEFVDWQLSRQIFYQILVAGGDVMTPAGSPQCSDVPEVGDDQTLPSPMHLLTLLPELEYGSDCLSPRLCWQCVRLEP